METKWGCLESMWRIFLNHYFLEAHVEIYFHVNLFQFLGFNKIELFYRWRLILIFIKSIIIRSISFKTLSGRSYKISNIIYVWTLTSFANYSQMEICCTKSFPFGLRDSLHVLKVDDGKALFLWLHGAHFFKPLCCSISISSLRSSSCVNIATWEFEQW